MDSTIIVGIIGALSALGGTYLGHRLSKNITVEQGKNLFKSAALDKRLEVNQTAFTFALEFTSAANHPDTHEQFFRDCHTFWSENCLYMHPEVMTAFHSAYMRAPDWVYTRQSYKTGDITREEFKDLWNNFAFLPRQIFNAVGFQWSGEFPSENISPDVENNES